MSIIKAGQATQEEYCPAQAEYSRGLPDIIRESSCSGADCNLCVEQCPTEAIRVTGNSNASVSLDLGACISCGICTDVCPSGVFIKSLSTRTAKKNRADLIITNEDSEKQGSDIGVQPTRPERQIFSRSISIRVISTGCSACDLEIGAAFNPIFDMERFGVQLAASPRMADALVVAGPVGRGMQEALLRTYDAMPEPRLVVAAGTCAITGGVHKGGYTQANGLSAILPVDVFIPGCPPHPWSIIYGIMTAMEHPILRKENSKS